MGTLKTNRRGNKSKEHKSERKTSFFFIHKRTVVPPPHFDPAECAYYYSSDLGAYTAQCINRQLDQILQDRVLRREIRHLIHSLPSDRVILAGFGYTVPFMETFKRNCYENTLEIDDAGNKFSPITYSTLSLIPPRTNGTQYRDGAFLARRSGTLHTKTRLLGVEETKWPFLDNSIPFVFMMHSMECIKNPEGALDEASRILVPNGELWVAVPHPWTLWSRSPHFLMCGQRHYEVKEIVTILKNRGFRVKGFEPFGAYPQWWGAKKPFRLRTNEITERWFFGDFLDFVAKRLFPFVGGMFIVRATPIK